MPNTERDFIEGDATGAQYLAPRDPFEREQEVKWEDEGGHPIARPGKRSDDDEPEEEDEDESDEAEEDDLSALDQAHTDPLPFLITPTDAWVRRQVMEALRRRGDIDARSIDVYVADGEVTLLGSIDSLRSEVTAQLVAERCLGVRSVISQMTLLVRPYADYDEGMGQAYVQ